MTINTLNRYFHKALIFIILCGVCLFMSESCLAQGHTQSLTTSVNYAEPSVSLVFKDTLTLPSLTEFSLPVRMKTGHEISAITLGLYFPQQYLEITGMQLAHVSQGYHYNIHDSLFNLVWSDINPIALNDDDTLLILEMKTLDLSLLSGTIRLGLNESSEFADISADVIEGVVLEMPEINYFNPGPIDTLTGFYVTVNPNPFSDFATVNFSLTEKSRVKISIENLSGMEIIQLADGDFPRGPNQVRLYASDLSNGIYLLKFEMKNSLRSGSKVIKVFSLR